MPAQRCRQATAWIRRSVRMPRGLLLALTLGAWPAMAHHSFALFDMTRQIELTGTVLEFQWTNPHSWIEINVSAANGALQRWSIEVGSPLGLKRQGWTRDMIKPGDKLQLQVHPLRDGRAGGALVTITLPDGRKFGTPLEGSR